MSSLRVKRTHRAGRPDRQHPRGVARSGDAAVLLEAQRVLPEVTRSRDDGDALVGDLLRGQRQRVGPVRLVDAGADRHVHDLDVVGPGVDDHPVQRRDDVADAAAAGGIQHLERNQRRARRDARLVAVRVVAVAEDDAGDVRTVTIVVVWQRPSVDEVHELGDALVAVGIRLRRAALGQVVVPGGDAGVDDGDANAGAGVAERALHDASADRDGGAVVVRGDRAIIMNLEDVRLRFELLQQVVWKVEHDAIDDVEFVESRKSLELGRHGRAGNEGDDHAGGLKRVTRRTTRDLVVHFVIPGIRAWHAAFLLRAVANVASSSRSIRRQSCHKQEQ